MSSGRSPRTALLLFGVTLAVYGLTTYGGVRSPDEEVVFLTAEALAHHGTFALASGPEGLPDFGVARGVDGRLYSVFGPLQSIALVPAVWVADVLADRVGPEVPISLYSGDGFVRYMRGERATDPHPHAVRFVASFLDVIVSAVGVVLLWLVARRITDSELASVVVALAYGFGSLAWAYGGTLFTEPLATALALGSLLAALGPRRANAVTAGVLIGLSVATHVTAILFAPFFLAVTASSPGRDRGGRAVAYALGFGVVAVALGWHDLDRFGSVLETGRFADPVRAADLAYGEWVAPWRGLYGLTVSAGKGILLYCPIVLLGFVGWPSLHRRSRLLSWTLGGAAVTRLAVIASRSDWHGGFCIGPRLLLMIVPFLLVPLACWVAEKPRRAWPVAGAVSVAAVEQAYLALAEPFRFLHWVRVTATAAGVPVFTGDRLYLDWIYSPLVHLIRGGTGSWVFAGLSTPLHVLVLATGTIVTVLVFGGVALQRPRRVIDLSMG